MDHADGPAAAHYAALRHESAPRRWLIGATIGAIAGLFTVLVLPWPLPLLAALVTLVALMIWDSGYGTLADLWPGNRKSHRLAAAAVRLERRGWIALPAPALPHHDVPLAAFLLIGPPGVFVIDHQVWGAADIVTTDPTTGLLMVGGKPALRRITSVKGAAAAVAEALAGRIPDHALVRPIVTVDGPTLGHLRQVAGTIMLPIADLGGLLAGGNRVLSRDEFTALGEQARRLYGQR